MGAAFCVSVDYPKKLAGTAAGPGGMRLMRMMVVSCSSFGKNVFVIILALPFEH
jgi:hypothetical protein